MKKKLGIILDSFVGLSKEEVEKLGFKLLPLQFSLDGRTYNDDGVEISKDDLPRMIDKANVKFTSLPSLALIESTIKEMSEKYEQVIVLTISSKLSSTFATTSIAAKAYENVTVIDNNLTGYQFVWLAQLLEKLYEQNTSVEELVKVALDYSLQCLAYIVPKNINALIKGGRIKGIKKMILSTFGIIPIIKFDKEGNKPVIFKRRQDNAVKTVIKNLINYIGGEKNISKWEFQILHTSEKSIVDMTKEILSSFKITVSKIVQVSATIIIHTGLGSVSVSISPKI